MQGRATINPHSTHPHMNQRDPYVDDQATDDERLMATFMHLCVLGNHVGIPVVAFIVSLVLWLMKRDESPYIDDHGREAINFQISLLIWYTVAALLTPVCGIGVLVALVVIVIAFVTSITNAIRANRGEYVRYPITIRFI